MEVKKTKITDVVIVIVILIIIIVFIASLGTVKSDSFTKLPLEFKDSKEEAKRRHSKLVELVQKQESLKRKLEIKFKWIYFFVRLLLVSIWFGLLLLFYCIGLLNDIGDLLNYSEAGILIIILFNFLTFGTLTNLDNYIKLIKTKTENWIYGKYIKLHDKIESHKSELNDLEKTINES